MHKLYEPKCNTCQNRHDSCLYGDTCAKCVWGEFNKYKSTKKCLTV